VISVATISFLSLVPAPLIVRGVAQDGEAGTIYQEDDVQQVPTMTKVVKPWYPSELKEAEIEGTVLVEAVILADGRVDPASVKVVKSLHPRLDEETVRALLASEFSPGRREGRPVAVAMRIPYAYRFTDSSKVAGGAAPVGDHVIFGVQYTRSDFAFSVEPTFGIVQLLRRSGSGEDPGEPDAFAPSDTLVAVVELPGAPSGTLVTGRWLYTEGGSRRLITESRHRTKGEGDEAPIFVATKITPWPEGTYAFELLIDGRLGPRIPFRVTR
jgi:TonB family protein